MDALHGSDDLQNVDDIFIRPFDIDDIDDFMVWATDDMATRYLPWNTYTSKEEGIEFLQKEAIPHPYFRAICWEKRVVGSITVTPYEGKIDECRAQLAYVLATQYSGKGIATKAVRLVVSDVFRRWPELERIQAVAHLDNVASQRVLEKVGFNKEGVLRKYMRFKCKAIDIVMFSFLSSDQSFKSF